MSFQVNSKTIGNTTASSPGRSVAFGSSASVLGAGSEGGDSLDLNIVPPQPKPTGTRLIEGFGHLVRFLIGPGDDLVAASMVGMDTQPPPAIVQPFQQPQPSDSGAHHRKAVAASDQ